MLKVLNLRSITRERVARSLRLAAVCFCLLTTAAAIARPPGGNGGGNGGGGGGGEDPPPEPPLGGTIYYRVRLETGDDQLWGMDPDGNNAFPALPVDLFAMPSSLQYGTDGHRWWLKAEPDGRVYDRLIHSDGSESSDYPHRELYALRIGYDTSGEPYVAERFPITDSFGKVIFSTYQDMSAFEVAPDYTRLAQWSADRLDTFVSCRGLDIRGIFRVEEDGSTVLDTRGSYDSRVCSIDVPEESMPAGQFIESGKVFSTADITVLPLTNGTYEWAPDGLTVLSEATIQDPSGSWHPEIQVRDALTDTLQWTYPAGQLTGSATWSPSGDAISFCDFSLWKLPLDAAGDPRNPILLFESSNSGTARKARWSPTGEHLVVYASLKKRGVYDAFLLRMKSDGTGVVDITPFNVKDYRPGPFIWVPNSTAP